MIYDVYVRAVCDMENSNWSQRVTFELQSCSATGGEPINLTACAVSGTGCFDLTVNDSHVLGGLNHTEYTITYHTSLSDATSGSNAISKTIAYCSAVAQGSIPIYVRLYNNVSQVVIVSSFTITAQETMIESTPLQAMIQCDEDTDSIVIFDLSTAAAQIGINPLTYYESLNDAVGQTSPITNSVAFSVNVMNPLTTIFIREAVTGSCDRVHSLPLNALANCNFEMYAPALTRFVML